MCLVDKKNWKFMGCMNLTKATLALGIILIIKAVICTFIGYVLNIYSIVFGIACMFVAAKPHSVILRSVLVIMFWIEVILLAVNLLLLCLGIAYFEDKLSSGDYVIECRSVWGETIACDTIKTWMYVVLAI